MNPITHIHSREILDSRGNPTVEVDVYSGTTFGRALVPSGASTGIHEALELRDNNPQRFHGKGVTHALENIQNIIAPALQGKDVYDQKSIDSLLLTLDGTENKSKLGANALLGVSMAALRCSAQLQNMPLWKLFGSLSGKDNSIYVQPRPMMNVINGGQHADSGLSIQEFMIVPMNAPSVREAVRMGSEVFHTLKSLLKDRGESTAVGDEGGFAPHLSSHEAAFEVLCEAIEKSGYTPGTDISLAIDAAASEFYIDGSYHVLMNGNTEELSSSELTAYYKSLISQYPIISIEDSHSEDDFTGFASMMKEMGSLVQLVGDDLYVTNPKRIQKGIDESLSNSVLIKMNQIGTISETLDAIAMTHANNWTAVVSHRSGETEDTTLADLTVGAQTGQIKTGSLSRGERTCKYNQLMRIEESLQ